MLRVESYREKLHVLSLYNPDNLSLCTSALESVSKLAYAPMCQDSNMHIPESLDQVIVVDVLAKVNFPVDCWREVKVLGACWRQLSTAEQR